MLDGAYSIAVSSSIEYYIISIGLLEYCEE